MNRTLEQLKILVAKGEVRISDHGYDELVADSILVRDVVAALPAAEVVEDYPDFPKGPCVLVLARDRNGQPIHAVWGIPKGERTPAVLVTAYRPTGLPLIVGPLISRGEGNEHQTIHETPA